MDGDKVNPAVGIPRQKLLTAMFEVNEEGSIKEDSEMDGQKDVHLYDKPVSIKAVEMIVKDPPFSTFLAAPKNLLGL